MSFRNELGMLAVSMMLMDGCEQGTPAELDDADKSIKVCNLDGSCQSPNCDDINQPDQGMGTDFSMRLPNTTADRYKITGFYKEATGGWRVRGFTVNQANKQHVSADGWVKGAIIEGVSRPVVHMNAKATKFALTVCMINSTTCPSDQKVISGAALEGNQIVIDIPVLVSGRTVTPRYTLTFNSVPQPLDITTPSSPDVYGYHFTYESKGVPLATLCAGPGGVAQRTMFYQEAYWHPRTFAKTAESSAITVSCEFGAIASCMSWGYKPWEDTKYNGAVVFKDSWHATCVNAKTANYCGDGNAWTRFGTKITVNDPLVKPVMDEGIKYLEARWDTAGAVCVNEENRRIFSMDWTTASCYGAMKDCKTFDNENLSGTTYLNTGIPSPNPTP